MAVAGFPLRRQAPRVFVDESGFHTSMRRLRARAPKGTRAYGKVSKEPWQEHHPLIAAITLQGAMGTSVTVEGATDSLRPLKPTSSNFWHPLFVRVRWWYSMGSGRTGHRG